MDKEKKKELQATYKERKITGGICAIKNIANGKMLISSVVDLQAYKNRYEFSKITGSCVNKIIEKDWNEFGSNSFEFVALEELEKKETQTDKEFAEDLETLEEMWLEKVNPHDIY
jgi:hypothetical protein